MVGFGTTAPVAVTVSLRIAWQEAAPLDGAEQIRVWRCALPPAEGAAVAAGRTAAEAKARRVGRARTSAPRFISRVSCWLRESKQVTMFEF